MRFAGSKQDLLYVIKSKALKRKYESEADLRVLENQYSDLRKRENFRQKKKRKKMQKNIQFATFFNTCKIMKIFLKLMSAT